jgi:hypothetical protein
MLLGVSHQHIQPFRGTSAGFFDHGKCLAHTGRHSEEDLEPSTLLFNLVVLEFSQELVGIRSLVGHRLLPLLRY